MKIKLSMGVLLFFHLAFPVFSLAPQSAQKLTSAQWKAFQNAEKIIRSWFANPENYPTDEFTWLPLSEDTPTASCVHFENKFMNHRKQLSLKNVKHFPAHFFDLDAVYHGTTLFEYLWLKHLGFLDPDAIEYFFQETMEDEEYQMAIPGFFMATTPKSAQSYSRSKTRVRAANFVKMNRGGAVNHDDHFLRLLRFFGVPLQDPDLQTLLSTPVVLKIQLEKDYGNMADHPMFEMKVDDRNAGTEEIIAPFPPLRMAHVEVLIPKKTSFPQYWERWDFQEESA